MKQVTLTITCEYADDADSDIIRAALHNVAAVAAGNGLMTEDGMLSLESWDCDVTIGDDPVRTALTDLVDSYDDTGCEECGVVGETAYKAGKKALGR